MRYIVALFLVMMLAGWCAGATKQVSIKNDTGETLYNYPVELIITTQINWSDIDSDFSSLRFFEDGRPVDYWIEYLDATNQKAVIWVCPSVIPTSGKRLYMTYSATEQLPYKPTTHTPVISRPSAGLTLATYPTDEASANLSNLHPSVVKVPAGSWMAKAADEDAAQNVFWVMVNTPFPPTAMVDGKGFSAGLAENPALWVSNNSDPTVVDSWSWPSGTATWPYDASGDTFNDNLNRVHATLHTAGTDSNLIVAPTAGFWSDPEMIWIAATNTLRVYFRHNGDKTRLYYCNITSSGTAWTDTTDGSSLLSFDYGYCTYNTSAPLDSDAISKELMSPSIFYSNALGKYVLVTQTLSATKDGEIAVFESTDGLDWARRTGVSGVTLEQMTGLEKQCWHIGVIEADKKWFLFGTTASKSTLEVTSITKRVACWVSSDYGLSWKIQRPLVLNQDFRCSSGAGNYQTVFQHAYRPYPIWDEGGQGFILFCGFRQDGNGSTADTSLGGTMAVKDTTWSPYYQRQVSPISSVFFLRGLDFSDNQAQTIKTGSLGWPAVVKDLANTTTTFAVSGDGITMVNSAPGNGVLFSPGSLPQNYQTRFRMKTASAYDWTYYSMQSQYGTVLPEIKLYTATSSNGIPVAKVVQGGVVLNPEVTITGQYSMATYPVTFDQRVLASGGASALLSSLQILRHNGVDSAKTMHAITVSGVVSEEWREYGAGTFAMHTNSTAAETLHLYWVFSKPAFVSEPTATITSVSSSGSNSIMGGGGLMGN